MTAMPPLALLAGGLAKRMRPLTDVRPKAMLDVAGEPFIAHQLRLMRREGIGRVVMCVGYKWEMIRDFVGDGGRFGLEVIYRVDGPTLLGTGGALRNALPDLGPEFIVMYGDSWLDARYGPIVEAFRQSGKAALMTVFRNDGRWDRSNIWFENGEIRRYDKKNFIPQMQYIDWGLGILKARAIADEPADRPFDLADVYGKLLRNDELMGFEVKQRFYEIGSPEGLRETEAVLRASGQSL